MPAAIGNFHSTIQTKWHVNIDLPCIIAGVPAPNVKWTFNGQPIDLHSQRLIYDNFTLHLDSVTGIDSGNYTCTARNVYGSENVTTVLLVVGKYYNYFLVDVAVSHNNTLSYIIGQVLPRTNKQTAEIST